MKHLLFSIPFLLFSTTLPAIGDYEPGDTLYVWALSGLTLRAEPSLASTKMVVIPYGTALVVQNYSVDHSTQVTVVPKFKTGEEDNPALTFGGDFARLTFEGKTGYAFDGYLSKLPALRYSLNPQTHRPKFEDHVTWATRSFGLLRKSEKGRPEHGYPYHVKWIFGNGIMIDGFSEKSGLTRIILPDISMEEAFMMFSFSSQYEWEIKHPTNNPADYPWHFSMIKNQLWHFSNGACDHLIQALPEKIVLLVIACSC